MAQSEELKRLNAARGQCKGLITKLHTYVYSEEIKRKDLETLQIKKDRLIQIFADYEKHNLNIKYLDNTDTENFDDVEDKYCTILARLNTLIKALTPCSSADYSSKEFSYNSHANGGQFQRLPRINLKTFSGETSEYLPFINMYNSVVHNNETLNECDKLYYLTSFLSGEALNVIKHLSLTADNYTIALNLLKQRYHNKVKIITHHVNSILDISILKRPSSVELRSLISNFKQHLGALENLIQGQIQWDTILVCILQRKLDFYTVRTFYLERQSANDMPSIKELLSFLENRAIALETASQRENVAQQKERKYPLNCNVAAADMKRKSNNNKYNCKLCSHSHQLYSCAKFKLSTLKERNEFVRKHGVCKLCLNEHTGKCKFNFRCQICKRPHNTLLHMDGHEQQTLDNENSSSQVSLSCNTRKAILLPTAQVLVQCQDGSKVPVRALLDTGSQVSLVCANIIDKIGLQSYCQNDSILGICQGIRKINRKIQLKIFSSLNNFQLDINCSIVDKITSNLPQFQIDLNKMGMINLSGLADKQFHTSAPIDILLGCDVFFQALVDQPRLLEQGIYSLNTHFGDIIAGSVPKQYVNTPKVSLSINISEQVSKNHTNDLAVSSLNEQMSKFWMAEKIPEIYSENSSEQELAETIFQQTVVVKDNRFTVALPLKQPIEQIFLGDSLSAALQRFYNLERRLSKDTQLYQMYKDFINEYITLGHAEPYDITQYDLKKDAVFFLAHHPVFNYNSPSTKMRCVFDGSLKTKNNISLNDVLLNGPIAQNELFDILILFRLPKYILLCDIKQMFRQILLHPQYRVFQNILWRDSINHPVSCFQLKTVTYGLKSSSYLATRCLLELAERFKEKYNLGSTVLKSQVYVDDILTGHDCIDTLKEIKIQLIELLSLGGFQLHKWGSNDVRLLDNISSTEKTIKDVDMSKDTDFIKTLGLRYNVKSDYFYISCSETTFNDSYTKRQVLSFISKIFDPLGLVGPAVMSAKLIMQSIYQTEVLWDEELPREINEQWIKFARGLIQMSPIQINRHINIKGAMRVELVGFADASNKAYGCCLYVRSIHHNGTVNVNLLCSKSRANSINNELSTPRKELNSAVLLSILTKKVYQTLKTQCNDLMIFLYLDSQIVLAWLNVEPVRLKSYVANRIIKIKELTNGWPWFYVKTTDNPADCLSRGIDPQALQMNDTWWHGPMFLRQINYMHENASHDVTFYQQLPEVKEFSHDKPYCNEVCNSIILSTEEFFNKFSDISKLKRSVSYIMRFAYNCKTKNKADRRSGYLQPDELDKALLKIIKLDQHMHYSNEIACLKSNKPLKGSLATLNPFLDREEILRVGGRLQNSQLSYTQMHPIILVKASHVTNLIIWKEHEILLHAGPKLLISSLNQRYWLINAIREIKHVIHKCLKCFRLKAKAASQLMGSYPSQRVTEQRPFEVVGIDYTGAFNIKLARVRKPIILKSYVLIFVCFVTKAIHVELASDMTTVTFLNCFKRFISRRNKPSQVFCDNASTFKSANSQLQELYKLQSSAAHQDAVTKFSADQGITFKFIPAYSPVFGGLWEAGVKALKYHLKRVVGDNILTYEELNTVIIQIEAILNARPLTAMSTDPTDMSYLTPGHFLTGAPITSYPEQDVTNIPYDRLNFWKKCNHLKQNFFKQWHKSYLSTLQNRPKWKKDNPNIKEGMLVMLKDDNITPFNWPMARIVKLYPGRDNKVRAFDVKLPNGKVMRTSITKICILPINEC